MNKATDLSKINFLKALFLHTLRFNQKCMRVVGEIPHPECKITVLSWNNRYLIKLEQGLFEQTYKINEFDVFNESDVIRLLDDSFVQDCLDRFAGMHRSLTSALERL